ncbi:hypothetical protein M3Y97_01018500 [Aphelenchoides bicaudatus]|nr:hypothetical protein M3Y97_01018500 [Aphelenchoides bicaudatus]
MQSSILSTINHIRDTKTCGRSTKFDAKPLYNVETVTNICNNLIYLTLEVRFDSLDKGQDPTPPEKYNMLIATHGLAPVDIVGQITGKELGGSGTHDFNMFPLNSTLDITNWKLDEDKVYNYIKQGENRTAKLTYGLEYPEPEYNQFDEIKEPFYVGRPKRIYYHFVLCENGSSVGDPVEGMFENPPPVIPISKPPSWLQSKSKLFP